ncbi:acetyl-coenzyme A carboxyl transferase alpha chain [Vibrio astriarenae]|nr:acetyl-coenzyme A carboxyl transferase alpha chain [Vibrio sp. C7]
MKALELIDEIIEEPLGGAHRDYAAISGSMKALLLKQLAELEQFDNEALLERRYERLMSYGYC